jgi:hypothetical protein
MAQDRLIPDYASLHPGYGKREPFGGDSALSCLVPQIGLKIHG